MNSNIPNTFASLSSAERTRLYREQIEEERQQRMAMHRQAIAAHRQLMAALPPGTPQPLNLFADGDSWFDYPLPFPPLQHTDVMAQIPNLSARKPFILNLAHHGDEARDKLGVQQRQRIEYSLTNPAHGPFDAILFSGGGNDTVGDQFCLWLNDAAGLPPAQALNLPRLNNVIGVVRSAYEDLISIRDRLFPSTPVFIHGYDFAIPTNIGVCGFGPWLHPSLEYRNWMNLPIQTQIVHAFLLEFDALMQQIESAHRDVIYIRTQGTLVASDWTNELHPNPAGFGKITQKFVAALRTRFGPGSI
jgi:hypothetical protein